MMPAERLVVVWRVTSRCNLGCPFCHFDRNRSVPRREADPNRVRALAERLAERQRSDGLPVLVSWLGGEPYLWPPLVELTHDLRHRLGLATGVTTNGSALGSETIRRHVLADLDELTVSVDGLNETHDRLRGRPGAFAHLRRAVGEIASEVARSDGNRPLIRVNTVLFRDNLREFPTLCRELATWGVREVTFNQLGGVDRPRFHARHHLRRNDVSWLADRLPGLRAELAAHDLTLRGSPAYLTRFGASATGRRLPVADCRPGERFLFLDEAGMASPCSHTAEELGRPGEEVVSGCVPFHARARACHDCLSTQVFGKFTA